MRISGNGKRVPMGNNSRKTSSKSLEKTIAKGGENIARGSSNTRKGANMPSRVNLEEKILVENEKAELEIKQNIIENQNSTLDNKNAIHSSGKSSIKNKKEKSRKQKDGKLKKKPLVVKPIGKLGGKRISCMVLCGILGSIFVGGVSYGLYYNIVRYPCQMKEDIESSGLGGINRWVEAINTCSNNTIKGITGDDSFLAKELEYANGNENKIKFIKKMVSTVAYTPKQVEAKNIYGNPLISRVDDKVVYTSSLVNDTEEVTVSYIDYTKVPLDEGKIRDIVSKNKLTIGLGDYSNGLVEVFCEYMNSLNNNDIPLAKDERIPYLVKGTDKYFMTGDEDVYLDKVLFSSKEFHDLLIRFSEVVAKGMVNPDWTAWSKLSDEAKKGTPEPSKILEELPANKEWVEWNSKSEEEKKTSPEPIKYDSSRVMSNIWCGSYYLINEYKSVDSSGNVVGKKVEAEFGDGTFENPSSINTGVVTSMFVTDMEGNRVAKPIKVKLIDYRVSQDALNYFESKDIRNRGYDIKSEVQYASYTFEVTNLSDDELTIYDNSSLSDRAANLAPRTGTVYGLQSSVKLKPYQTGIIESWGCSTELNNKYLIWGGDFNRELPVVWFRVLSGNLEDTSEDKGVTLNNIR